MPRPGAAGLTLGGGLGNAARRMRPRALALLAALAASCAAGALGGCSANPATGSRSFTAFMSPEEEARLGRQEHPRIVAQFGGEHEDARLRGYVSRIGDALAARSEVPGLGWRFTMLDSDVVNAFALPGGHVYATRALLALASSEAELAGVLGHEIGHVTARHTAQRYSSGVLAQAGTAAATILGGVFLGGAGAQLAQNTVGGTAQLALAGYSRDQEFEADTLGVRYLARGGYDTAAMASFLAKMQMESALQAELAGRPGAADEFSLLQSHPRTPDRVRQARAAAGLADDGPDARIGEDDYLAAIDGLSWGGDARNGFVRNEAFVHPALRLRFSVPRGFRIVNGDSAVIASGPGGGRILFDRDARAPRGQLAAYLAQAGFQQARPATIGGLPAASGAGRVRTQSGQELDVSVVLVEGADAVWRFRFLSPPESSAALGPDFGRTAQSFRQMSPAEASAARPFRIRALRAGAGDTQEGMARRMAVVDLPLRRFQVLNGLQPGEALKPGRRYKVIAD